MAPPHLILSGVALAIAAPAFAQTPAPAAAPAAATSNNTRSPQAPASATRIPEPDTIALFIMAGVGLFVGRRLSVTKRRRQPDT